MTMVQHTAALSPTIYQASSQPTGRFPPPTESDFSSRLLIYTHMLTHTAHQLKPKKQWTMRLRG